MWRRAHAGYGLQLVTFNGTHVEPPADLLHATLMGMPAGPGWDRWGAGMVAEWQTSQSRSMGTSKRGSR
jgi:hypothetical protein